MNKETVKLIRTLAGHSQEEMAAVAGYSKSYIGFIEQGIRPISNNFSEKIMSAYDLNESDLALYQVMLSKRKVETR